VSVIRRPGVPIPRNPLRLLAAVTATAAIAAVLAACGATGGEATVTADDLKGTWTGELNGYGMAKADNNVIKEFTITDVVGSAFTGQVRHRPADGDWETPELIDGVVMSDGTIQFVDGDGTYIGHKTGSNTLEVSYLQLSKDDASALVGTVTVQ
jgi:hypothetical protein